MKKPILEQAIKILELLTFLKILVIVGLILS